MGFPREIQYDTPRGEVSFLRQPDIFALHDVKEQESQVRNELFRLEPTVAVCRGRQPQNIRAAAVYRLQPNGPLAVPTGLVFIRLVDGEELTQSRGRLAEAGFEIESVTASLKNSGWVRHLSGEIDQALRTFMKLRALDGVVSVEPQMLTPRASKGIPFNMS